MTKRNYQKELDRLLESFAEKPRLLLQCCCAPCSSYVLEYLAEHFQITVYFYNPNITNQEEYQLRKQELVNFISMRDNKYQISIVEDRYEPDRFLASIKGHEKDLEGGDRCTYCYKLRLEETAKVASKEGFDYFCTTLSISPYKNSDKLMEVGEQLGALYQVDYLPSDFKKKGGYSRSVQLSKEFGLYRQDYCGCVFSKLQSERERKEHERSEK